MRIVSNADIKVNINGLESSNVDLMLDSTFESVEALKGYSVHPEHVAVADSKEDLIPRLEAVWIMRSKKGKADRDYGLRRFGYEENIRLW